MTWKKPDAVAADQFDKQKKAIKVLFNTIAAMTSTSLKDYPAAAGYYKAVLAIDPTDAVSHFRLGVVYLQMTPPAGNRRLLGTGARHCPQGSECSAGSDLSEEPADSLPAARLRQTRG